MSFSFDRRKFLGISLGAGAATLSPSVLVRMLVASDAASQVFGILKESLEINDRHRPLVAEFTQSLQTTWLHSKTPESFASLVSSSSSNGDESRQELNFYVTAEFIASTNYLAFKRGYVDTLAMIKGRKEHPTKIDRSIVS